MQDSTMDNNANNQAPQLSAIELRVLGVLMEKQLTTPDAYPLTLNSIITACNQKTSREPVSNYQQGDIARTLQTLEDKRFVSKDRSSRSDKFEQQFILKLALSKKQQALLCVMMLRGPQTLNELHTRTKRMCDFADKEEVEHCAERLCQRDTPYAVRMPQQVGQRGERFGHLFAGTPSMNSQAAPHVVSRPIENTAQNKDHNSGDNNSGDIKALERKMNELSVTVNALLDENAELKRKISSLYELLHDDGATP